MQAPYKPHVLVPCGEGRAAPYFFAAALTVCRGPSAWPVELSTCLGLSSSWPHPAQVPGVVCALRTCCFSHQSQWHGARGLCCPWEPFAFDVGNGMRVHVAKSPWLRVALDVVESVQAHICSVSPFFPPHLLSVPPPFPFLRSVHSLGKSTRKKLCSDFPF